ncbi:MAG: GTP-binding protein [Verrucomicrobiae bacterium]|nr:GTP-binding protein [Verrucomicrobiae bacterium]
MIKKKVCLIGAYAVGKTSLVRRFVNGLFSEDYLTTVGVKIDQRTVTAPDGREVRMMIWDLAGRDEFEAVRKSYLSGASGFLYVADGTRRETLEAVRQEMAEIEASFPGMPSVLLVNKRDLVSDWEVEDADLAVFRDRGLPVHFTSAKTGELVAESFDDLAGRMIETHLD